MKLRGIKDVQESTDLKLYAVGYVDYIDKFGRRHRAGYGRVYNPFIDNERNPLYLVDGTFSAEAFKRRNNLPFITQRGYNYDRERKKGQGNDWDEPDE